MNKVRTRFAPSPTGLLHIGGVRTALFNYVFAKANNGEFILRLEDTDRERFVAEGVEQIIKSLDWIGLHPDEGVWYETEPKPGEVGPYIQSERLPHYEKYAKELIDRGLAYYSYISPEQYNSWKEETIKNRRTFVYSKHLEAEYHDPKLQPPEGNFPIRIDIAAIRDKFKKEKHSFLYERVDWDDEIRGEFSDALVNMDDFIIMKADGYPTYNFANVVDDHLMQISHVIRGDEFLSSTAKHVLLYKVLGWKEPKFVHLPPILGPDGKKKLSKRDGDVDVLEYESKGYLKEALVNFLALLGWNDGSEQEIFNLDELIAKFDLGRLQKSPARFDLERLDWMNGEYIRKLSISDLSEKVRPFVPTEWYANQSYFEKVLTLDKDRLKRLDEAKFVMEIFFETPKVDTKLLCKKESLTDIKLWLKETVNVLENNSFQHDALEKDLRDLVEKLGIKTGQLFSVIRIGLTGREQAPGLFDILATLGKEESLKRITKIIS